ncbi:NAD(P)-dependent oxidoreductase [Streptomyces sp. NPDC059618]|uniref:NAD(P)-dependent oxidoreductase n=1 Tax=Streptomyces sp. NPDC059618 TaxID=3346887 RepID=UPI0036A23D0E
MARPADDPALLGSEARATSGLAQVVNPGYEALTLARLVHVDLGAVAEEAFGSSQFAGRTFGMIGLGAVGGHVARLLNRAGARLVVTDIAPAAHNLVEELGATWVDPTTPSPRRSMSSFRPPSADC